MLKRVAAVAALSLLPLVAAPAPAQAAGTCNISVPSKVSITKPYRTITATYSSGCRTSADWAWWDVVHPRQGPWHDFMFTGRSKETIDWYDSDPRGTYTVRADEAWDHNYRKMKQNSPKMTVKLGSKVGISTSRSGTYVTVRGTATRYTPNAERFRSWSGATVTLRSKSCSSCSWKKVKTTRTNSAGKVSIRTKASSKRYWKITTLDSSNTWGKTSSTLRR